MGTNKRQAREREKERLRPRDREAGVYSKRSRQPPRSFQLARNTLRYVELTFSACSHAVSDNIAHLSIQLDQLDSELDGRSMELNSVNK